MRRFNWFRSSANFWSIVSAFFLALVLLLMVIIGLWYSRPPKSLPAPSTAILNVIPAPTATPLPSTATATPAATATVPAPPPGVIAIEGYVQIVGTGGDGLRLRSAPGLDQNIMLVGAEDEIFQVVEGPQEKDGYVWWYLAGLYDPNRSGWAVANYLQGIQGP